MVNGKGKSSGAAEDQEPWSSQALVVEAKDEIVYDTKGGVKMKNDSV